VPVWTEDEAGPYQAIPQPGTHWRPTTSPARYPHEHIRHGTAKLLTLFHPASGQVRVTGVASAANEVLHSWLKAELTAILATLPDPPAQTEAERSAAWERWQDGLTVPFTLPERLPPLRLLLVLDNLTGHKTAARSCSGWLSTASCRCIPHSAAPGSTWPNPSSASSSAGRWLAKLRPRPTTSSTGSKRPPAAGMPIPPRSSGPASADSDASAAVNATTMPSAGPVPAHVVRSIVDFPHSINGGVHAK
jgi:hypothetical protein